LELTVPEFCSFNLKSRIQLVIKDGVLLVEKVINSDYLVRVYKLYSFHVEVLVLKSANVITKAEPLINKNILKYFYLQ
jgi:hypothetical protein